MQRRQFFEKEIQQQFWRERMRQVCLAGIRDAPNI